MEGKVLFPAWDGVIGSTQRKGVVSEEKRFLPQVQTAGQGNLGTKSFSMRSS